MNHATLVAVLKNATRDPASPVQPAEWEAQRARVLRELDPQPHPETGKQRAQRQGDTALVFTEPALRRAG